MTQVPSINVSAGRKLEKNRLDFDCSTTANFGIVQPTMCREMVPHAKFKVKVESLIRLAGMPVPTFGRMYLKHKHVFVPYSDVCPQFKSFLSGQPYYVPTAGLPRIPQGMQAALKSSGSRDSFVYDSLVPFDSTVISRFLLANFADYTIYKKTTITKDSTGYEYKPFLIDEDFKSDHAQFQLAGLKIAWNAIFNPAASSTYYYFNERISISNVLLNRLRTFLPSAPSPTTEYDTILRNYGFNQRGVCRCGNWVVTCANDVNANDELFTFGADDNVTGLTQGGYVRTSVTSPEYIDIDNADYVSVFGDGTYCIAFRLKAVAKSVRTIMQGCGYQFTPNISSRDLDRTNWLKLLAFYKAWFNCFRPTRDLAFTDTPCYRLTKFFELPNLELYYKISDSDVYLFSDSYDLSDIYDFILDLGRDCYNYLPQDYFGISTIAPNQNMQANDAELKTYVGSLLGTPNENSLVISNSSPYVSVNGEINLPENILIALRGLKYVNKNTVAGRSIYDYFLSHYGIKIENDHDTEHVYEIGECTIPIQVSSIMSQADTADGSVGAQVGEYSGYGIGYSQEEQTFTFENQEAFGVWITLTCVMPKSGYYQGVLRENNNLKRLDFYTEEFDAAGYDVLARSEISADYPVSTSHWNPSAVGAFGENGLKGAFGFVPKYTHYKVGRNIVNGDLSLRSYKNDMAPYTLDRMLPYDGNWLFLNNGEVTYQRTFRPSYIPTFVFDEFRRIDPSDKLGQYNRIFYSTLNRDDHFIIHNVFNFTAWLPARSLSDSFETQEADVPTIKLEHS